MIPVYRHNNVTTNYSFNCGSVLKEKKEAIQRNIVPFFGLLRTIASKIRYNYRFLSHIAKLVPVKNSLSIRKFVSTVKTLKVPINSTSIFNVINLVDSIPKLIKSGRKFIHKDGIHKIPVALKIINTFSSIVGTFEDVRSGLAVFTTALKVSRVVSSIFSWIGIAGSVAETILSVRTFSRAQNELSYFKNKISYNKEGNYNFNDYKKLCVYFDETSPKFIAKKFGTNEIFYLKMRERLANLRVGDVDYNRTGELRNLIEDLKSRLEMQRNDKIVSLFSSTASLIVSVVTTVASITNPIFLLAWMSYNLVFSGVKHVVMQIKNYQFENKMGLIDRGCQAIPVATSPVVAKVKDFAKWYFGYYPAKT